MSQRQRVSVRETLEKMAAAREGAMTRLEQLDLETAVDVVDYDSMCEEEYEKHIRQVKREAQEFVVDDEGIGYAEGDQEDVCFRSRPSKPRTKKRSSEDEKMAPKKKRTATEKTREKNQKPLVLQDVVRGSATPSSRGIAHDPASLNAQLHKMELQGSSGEPRLSENDASQHEASEDHSVVAPKAEPNQDGSVDVLPSLSSAKENPSRHPTVSARRRPSEPLAGEHLPFFFLDADDVHETHGTVYLFGKVAKEGSDGHVSCCVRIPSVERTLYFVPKEGLFDPKDYRLHYLETKAKEDPQQRDALVAYLDQVADPLKNEAQSILKAKHVQGPFKMKIVRRNYAFDTPSVSHGLQYVLKVSCPGKGSSLPSVLQGQTFQAVMGTRQSLLESVLLRRRVMGPSWLALTNPAYLPQDQHRSWCEVEVEIRSHKCLVACHKDLRNRPPPPLDVAALQLKTLLDPQSNTHRIQIATLALLKDVPCDHPMHEKEWNTPRRLRCFHAVASLREQAWPPGVGEGSTKGLTLHSSEQSLLKALLEWMQETDPDVLVGHDITNVDLSLLLHRMQHQKVEAWSSLGRLKRTRFPSLAGKTGPLSVVTGRLLCDTFISAHEHLKETEFSLTTLARSQLGEVRKDMSGQELEESYGSARGLHACLETSTADALLTLKLVFHLSVIPLTKQLTNLSGSLWNKTLQGQKAQRTDMLLLHEFHNRKFLLPEKKPHGRERDWDGHEGKRGGGPQYAGGLVLEPKKGLYDNMVLLLDFNSLYPSIIQEFRLCFTTVDRSGGVPVLPGPSAPADAPLPTVIKGLIDSRRQVKQFIATEKDPLVLKQRKIREQALKLTANSMYGCLGFAYSRFFCRPLAELITLQGRTILQKTVDLVEKQLGYEVVYGDTDSIMIHTGVNDYDAVRHTIAEKIKRAVNKNYRTLKIDVDGIFQPLLLLKKKKYAAVKLLTENGQLVRRREDKGLDIVRRDWSRIAKSVGNRVLDEILSGRPSSQVVEGVHRHLKEIRACVERGEVPLSEFEIVKELAKRPEEYVDAKAQPHVQVALRRKQQGYRDGIHPGQAIPYVICCVSQEHAAGGGSHQAERAYHPEELRQRPRELKVDSEFYLANQIHAVVSRLCEPIVEIDARSLAESLGLDSTRYRARILTASALPVPSPSQSLFQGCDPLALTNGGPCFPFCGVDDIIRGEKTLLDAMSPPDTAEESSVPVSSEQMANAVTLQARRCISDYYDAYFRAEDDDHEKPTRIPHYAEETAAERWTRVTSEGRLYRQLSFLVHQVDIESATERLDKGKPKKEALVHRSTLVQHLQPTLEILKEFRNASRYGVVDWEDLLRPF